MHHHSPRARVHLLITLGLCLMIVTVLAVPVLRFLESSKGKFHTGNFLKQIVVSISAYHYDLDGGLPAVHPVGTRVPTAFYRSETLGAFAVLAAWSQGDITARMFWPRDRGFDPPRVLPRGDGGGWLDQPAVFAYDWSLPGRYMSSRPRPLVGQRDPQAYDGEGINVGFTDGHYEFIRTTPGTAETPPVRESDPPLPWSVPYAGDDLFTRTDDGPGMDVVGGGSATRCFLK